MTRSELTSRLVGSFYFLQKINIQLMNLLRQNFFKSNIRTFYFNKTNTFAIRKYCNDVNNKNQNLPKLNEAEQSTRKHDDFMKTPNIENIEFVRKDIESFTNPLLELENIEKSNNNNNQTNDNSNEIIFQERMLTKDEEKFIQKFGMIDEKKLQSMEQIIAEYVTVNLLNFLIIL